MTWTPKVWRSETNPLGPPAAGPATPLSGSALTAEFQAAHDYVDALTTADNVRFVSNSFGSDASNGRSLGGAKKTIEAAVADLPSGGNIQVVPGNYIPPSTITLNQHTIFGLGRGPSSAGNSVIVQHTFNGDLFAFAPGSQTGGIENVYLRQATVGLSGAAIKASSTVGSAAGYFWFRNLVFSGVGGWERNVWLDGSANAIGIRSVFFNDSELFGTTVAGENVLINKGVHVFFTACDVVQAPEAAQQGVKILDAFSEDIYWNGKVLGDWNTAAAGLGCMFVGRITGTITCQSGSIHNRFFLATDEATWVNSGGVGNQLVGSPTGVRVKKTATTSCATATLTAIPFAAEDFDQPASQHDNVTNNTRLTCQQEGFYRIYGALVWAANATGERAIVFRLNGVSTYLGGEAVAANSTGADQTVVSASTTAHLNVGDYVECMGQQISGGPLNVDISSTSLGIPSHFGMERVT